MTPAGILLTGAVHDHVLGHVGGEQLALPAGEPVRRLAALLELLDHLRQQVKLARPRHEIHVARPLEDLLLDALGHAAHDAHDEVRALLLGALELAHPGPRPLLGVIADRAGVEEHNVRLLHLPGGLVALLEEAALHQLRVVLVHLAPEGDDVELGGLRISPRRGHPRRWVVTGGG